MNSILEKLLGFDTLTDQVIAMDLLTAAKTGIKLCAVGATESATPELKATFEKHLFEAIETHAKVTEYLIRKGWYRPYDINEQLDLDRKNVQTALSLPG